MAPPQVTAAPLFFDEEGYAKHLIGLAYSVVVAEHLLLGLQKVFRRRQYGGYAYCYHWDDSEKATKEDDDDNLFDDEVDGDDVAYI
jgi:hypothetical protein